MTGIQESTSLAPPFKRLGALLLDGIVLICLIAPAVIMDTIAETHMAEQAEGIKLGLGIFILLALIGQLVVNIFLLVRRSQTLGKYLLNIQMVSSKNGARITFFHWLFKRKILGENLVIGLIPFLNFLIYPFYFIADSLCIFSNEHQTLHDKIAKTNVVVLNDTHKRKSFFDFSALPTQNTEPPLVRAEVTGG